MFVSNRKWQTHFLSLYPKSGYGADMLDSLLSQAYLPFDVKQMSKGIQKLAGQVIKNNILVKRTLYWLWRYVLLCSNFRDYYSRHKKGLFGKNVHRPAGRDELSVPNAWHCLRKKGSFKKLPHLHDKGRWLQGTKEGEGGRGGRGVRKTNRHSWTDSLGLLAVALSGDQKLCWICWILKPRHWLSLDQILLSSVNAWSSFPVHSKGLSAALKENGDGATINQDITSRIFGNYLLKTDTLTGSCIHSVTFPKLKRKYQFLHQWSISVGDYTGLEMTGSLHIGLILFSFVVMTIIYQINLTSKIVFVICIKCIVLKTLIITISTLESSKLITMIVFSKAFINHPLSSCR